MNVAPVFVPGMNNWPGLGFTRDAGPIVAIGDGLYGLTTAARIGSSRTDAVAARAGGRVLLGHPPGACKPRLSGSVPATAAASMPAGHQLDLPDHTV
jgi:hypothetical protein